MKSQQALDRFRGKQTIWTEPHVVKRVQLRPFGQARAGNGVVGDARAVARQMPQSSRKRERKRRSV